jgi:membrane-associated phospholipid phosphatase
MALGEWWEKAPRLEVGRGPARRPRRGSLLGLAALLAVATPVRAFDPRALDGQAAEPAVARDQAVAPPADAPGSVSDGRRTLGRLPANLGRATIGVFHQDNLLPLVAGGAATGIASIWDEDVRKAAQPYGWGESLETAGGPIWSTAFVVGMFTAGRLSHGARFRAMTYDMLDAAIVNFAYTGLLKVAVGRERPNGQNDRSFPSGHASNAFALAAVAEKHYGWKLGVPAYVVAGLVGASRIQQDKHYLSDVVAGATLGYIVGRTVVRVNDRPLEAKSAGASLKVVPIVGRRAKGVLLALSY